MVLFATFVSESIEYVTPPLFPEHIVVGSSLIALAAVQLVWVWRMYDDSVADFRRRVESAIYKSIYKSFRMDAIPGLTDATYIKMDLDDFALYFEPNLLELDAFQPYHADVLPGARRRRGRRPRPS